MPTRDEIPGLGPKSSRPSLNPASDLSRVQLSPKEGFILSRIDGRVSYDEICRISSLGREETLAILRRLRAEKLILDPGDPSPTSPADEAGKVPRSSKSVVSHRGPKTPAPVQVTDAMLRNAQERSGGKAKSNAPALGSTLARLDDGSQVGAGDLLDGPDLSIEAKKQIIRLHRRLRRLAPHELLGVPKDADAAAIKRAFTTASKELHPDRYFGKDLGAYREKLAQIFARLSEAMQELEKDRRGKK